VAAVGALAGPVAVVLPPPLARRPRVALDGRACACPGRVARRGWRVGGFRVAVMRAVLRRAALARLVLAGRGCARRCRPLPACLAVLLSRPAVFLSGCLIAADHCIPE
jgi:hypothetical protein